MSFLPEPDFRHDRASVQPRTAILLTNLGTPDAPEAPALRRYLKQFLSDGRVVEIPRWIWMIILHGIILRVRPAKSAKKYASIWTKDGSPLWVWTQAQARLLQASLSERGVHVSVLPAMRYGQPGIDSQLGALKQAGVDRVLVLPLYPQYSGPTTASVFDAVAQWGLRTRHLPEFRFVNRYHDHPGYILALADRIRSHWATHGRGERLVLSFHGVPKRTLMLGDPYHCECLKTARLLREALGLSQSECVVTFQSRFGKAEWLQPYTEPTLQELARQGVRRVDVACPGFTSDCLETLEEIQQEAHEAFLAAGGQHFSYIPCLNDSAPWAQALADIAQQHLQGWPVNEMPSQQQLAQRGERAHAAGAPF